MIRTLNNGVAVDAIQRIIDGALQSFDSRLSVRFDQADEPEAEDDEFAVLMNGEEFRRGVSGAWSHETYSIQCCTFGGGYAASCYAWNADDELRHMSTLYEGRDAREAAAAITAELAKHKGASA